MLMNCCDKCGRYRSEYWANGRQCKQLAFLWHNCRHTEAWDTNTDKSNICTLKWGFLFPPIFFNKSGYWLIRLPINDYSADKGQTEAPRGKKKKRRDDNSSDKYELAWTHHSFVATQAFPVLLTQPGLTKIIIFFRIRHSNEHLYNHLHFFFNSRFDWDWRNLLHLHDCQMCNLDQI